MFLKHFFSIAIFYLMQHCQHTSFISLIMVPYSSGDICTIVFKSFSDKSDTSDLSFRQFLFVSGWLNCFGGIYPSPLPPAPTPQCLASDVAVQGWVCQQLPWKESGIGRNLRLFFKINRHNRKNWLGYGLIYILLSRSEYRQ